MKRLLLVLILLLAGCYVSYTDYSIMDKYCFEWCEVYHEDVRNAQWQGNDEHLKKTRCGCFYGKDLETCHLVPYKDYKHP